MAPQNAVIYTEMDPRVDLREFVLPISIKNSPDPIHTPGTWNGVSVETSQSSKPNVEFPGFDVTEVPWIVILLIHYKAACKP